jgi:hypothetical protein
VVQYHASARLTAVWILPPRQYREPRRTRRSLVPAFGSTETRVIQRTRIGVDETAGRLSLRRFSGSGGLRPPLRPPPPFAAPLTSSLRAHFRGDPPHDGPSAARTAGTSPSTPCVSVGRRQRHLETVHSKNVHLVRGTRSRWLRHVAASNVTEVHKLAIADRPIMRGPPGPHRWWLDSSAQRAG